MEIVQNFQKKPVNINFEHIKSAISMVVEKN